MKRTKAPPEALPFRRERVLAAGLLTLFAPVPLVFAESLEPVLFAVWAVLLGLHLLFVAKGRILVLPNWVLNGIGLAVFVLVFRYRFGFRSLLRTAVVLMLVTTLVKLAAVRRESDLSFVLSLAAFLFIGSLATSFHVSILVFVVPYAALAWVVLVRWSLWRELADAHGEWQRVGAKEIPRPGQVAVAVAAVLAAAIPFFLLLPRIRTPYVRGIQADSREIGTGFSETLDPSVTGVLKRSDRVQLRIEGDAAVMNEPGSLRLRTLAFSSWDGRGWSKPKGGGRMLPYQAASWVRLAASERDAPLQGRTLLVDLLPLRSKFIPVPSGAAAMRLAGSGQRRTGYWLERDHLSNILVPFTPDRNLQYEVLVGGAPLPDPRSPGPDDPSRSAVGSAPIRQFVVEKAGEPGPERSPEAVGRALEQELATRFSYSLEIPLRGQAPVEDFLFRQRRGHCEAFATAMAIALREVGIPTRLVTGFLGAEAGLFGNTWVVRGKNAHAWVEAWCGPERGWVVFDPTPAAGRPALERASWLSALRNAGEDVELFYNRWVLSFGESDQGDLVRWVREASEKARSWLSAAVRSFTRGRWRTAGVAAALALVVAAAWLVAALSGRKMPPLAGFLFRSRRELPASSAYRTAQRLLRKEGLPITPATAPFETVAAAATVSPRAATVVNEVVGLYLAESFGGRDPSRSEREGLIHHLKELRLLVGRPRPRKS